MQQRYLRILFLLPYPRRLAPSQRFRVEAFVDLIQQDLDLILHEFLDKKAWQILYRDGSNVQKAWAVLKGFAKRLFVVLVRAPQCEYIFIHREAAPLGPPVFEWFLAKVLRKKIIYDFDDAIWIQNISESNRLAASVKCFWKVKHICRWSHRIAAGNAYLASYAAQYNRNVEVLPTCVDTQNRYNRLKDQKTSKVVIGWTGSHSTLPYLDSLMPVLKRLEEQFDFQFLVICNQPPSFSLRSLKFIPWKEATEIDDLLQMNIGLMPLEQDAWSEGKCGFKIIQYLALGIPALASPVGVNKIIVEDGVNGFLCRTEDEWYEALVRLLQDETLRTQMGLNGRDKIVREYSIAANSQKFLSLFS